MKTTCDNNKEEEELQMFLERSSYLINVDDVLEHILSDFILENTYKIPKSEDIEYILITKDGNIDIDTPLTLPI